MTTTVVNIYKIKGDWKSDPNFVYIGRPGHGLDGYFRNPYPLKPGQARGSTLELYTKYVVNKLTTDPIFRERVKALKDKTLVCFCKPQACHGDILARIAESL